MWLFMSQYVLSQMSQIWHKDVTYVTNMSQFSRRWHLISVRFVTIFNKWYNFWEKLSNVTIVTNMSQMSQKTSQMSQKCHKFLDTLFFHSDSSPCLEAQCLRKVWVEKKTLFGHNSQKWHPSVSLWTKTLCFLNSQWLLIVLWQMSQVTGWWVFLTCSFLVLEETKALPQKSHSNGRLFSWSLLICNCRPCLVWNCFLQCGHLVFFLLFRQVWTLA